MLPRLLPLPGVVLPLFLLLAPARAQQVERPPAPRPVPRYDQPLPAPPRGPASGPPRVEPPRANEKSAPPLSPKARLDALFSRLLDAEDPAAARKAEREIERIFEQSGSPTADLIFTRASQALAARDYDTALDLLDYTLALRPRFAEAYHRRAQVHLLRRDEEATLRDLKIALGLEPRHFGALGMLAAILGANGNKKGAYAALTRLYELDPHFPDIAETIEKLRPEVEGQKI